MQELCEHLGALKNVLEHTGTFTMDELVDALSQMRAENLLLTAAHNESILKLSNFNRENCD